MKFFRGQEVSEKTERLVIDGRTYGVGGGEAIQITMPTGKYLYCSPTNILVELAKLKKWEIKSVNFFGACVADNINSRCDMPIDINGVDIKELPVLNKTEFESLIYLSIY